MKLALAFVMLIGITIIALTGHALAAGWLAFLALALLAGHAAPMRGQLGIAPDTNDIAASLNLDEILHTAITTFRRTMIALRVFATSFRVDQLQGTDKVLVPYYPLQGAASKDFSSSYDFATGAGSKTDTRSVTINKRKYQPLRITGRELARLPMLDAQTVGAMKGERLAYDVIQDVLSVVTAAHFPQVALTSAAADFDSDDVIDIRTACNKNAAGPLSVTDGVTATNTTVTSATALFHDNDIGITITGTNIPASTTIVSVTNATTATISAATTGSGSGITFTLGRPITPWPDTGRGLLVTPDYDGALLKDNSFKAAYAFGSSEAIRTGQLPNILGFNYAASAAIPTNGENLVGMVTLQSAILAAFSPIAPPPAARQLMTRYEIVDMDGMAIEYREWGNPSSDSQDQVIECNYGFDIGETLALKRIKSA